MSDIRIRRCVLQVLSVCLLLAMARPAAAQSTTGSIRGTVTDPSGAIVPGANVTITNDDKGLVTHVVAADDGEYVALALPPGRYTVSATHPGFAPATAKHFPLDIDQKARVNLTLPVGAEVQNVTVTGETPLLQTAGAETGGVISERLIVDLPLDGRNFLDLAHLVPGVTNGGNGNGTNLSISGQREQSNSITLNGVEVQGNRNNDTTLKPSVDAMAEFKVLTSAYAPEFGRASGGVVLLQTKAGTNQYHGDVYEFFRPNFTAATTPLIGTYVEPVLKRHNFGGTFGGPLLHNKAFFFVSYEGLRLVDHSVYYDTVPTTNEINYLGNGDVDLSGLTDPYTGNQIPLFDPFFFENNYYPQRYPNNLIPADEVDPGGKQILQKLFPLPTNNNFFNNYLAIQPYRTSSNTGNVRLDYTFSQNDKAYLTYDIYQYTIYSGDPFNGSIPIKGGGGADSGDAEYSENDTVGLIYDHSFSPRLLNEFHASYFMTPYHQNSLLDGSNLATQFGIQNANIPGFPQTYGFPQIQFETGATTGGSTYKPLDFRDHNFQFVDQLSWLHGSHNFKVGYEFRRLNSTPDFSLFPVPYEYFGGAYAAFTSDPTYCGYTYSPCNTPNGFYDPNAYYATGGSEIADLLLGLPYVVDQGLQLTNAHTQANEHTAYFQDYWQVTPTVNLTYGVRYEYQQPYVEQNNNASNFDPATLSVKLAGRGNNSRSLINSDTNNFAPRLGVAWQVKPETVVRAGFGLFYSPENDAREDILTKNYPFFTQEQFVNSPYYFSYFLTPGVPRPTTINIPPGASSIDLSTGLASLQTLYYVDPNIATGYSESYNLELQHVFYGKYSVTAGYVGAVGRKLPYEVGDLNIGHRLSSKISHVQSLFADGSNNYNALQVKVQKEMSHGLALFGSYTYGKTLDNGAAPFDLGTAHTPQNPFNLAAEYGPANYDLRHNAEFSALMELPFGRGRRFAHDAGAFTQAVVGGWQLNSLTELRSGNPLNIYYSNSLSAQTGQTLRPNLKPGLNPNDGPRTPQKWFNTAAFCIPGTSGCPAGQTTTIGDITFVEGTAGRNPVYGPGYTNEDMSLFKNFALPHETSFQLRLEAFNVLNIAHYNNPNTNLASGSQFGVISGGYNARRLQFAGKFYF